MQRQYYFLCATRVIAVLYIKFKVTLYNFNDFHAVWGYIKTNMQTIVSYLYTLESITEYH